MSFLTPSAGRGAKMVTKWGLVQGGTAVQATGSKGVPVTSGGSRSRWWGRLRSRGLGFEVWLVPGMATLGMGLLFANRPSLGWDEAVTWNVARRTPGEILDMAGNIDAVVAPYYFFMHYWMAVFGESELALRMPSIVAMAAAVATAAILARRLATPWVGLLSGSILAVVPAISRYAQEARAYGIALFLAVLTTLLVYRALEKSTGGRW